MTMIYVGGDMLSIANQHEHENEVHQLQSLGFNVYAPQNDKKINDKQNQTEDSNNHLAEKIVAHDTHGMEQADILIFEVSNNNVGTTVEIGQCLTLSIDTIKSKKFFFHSYDIRRTNIPEVGDRRSWSINQYLYGAIKYLNPKGIQDWDDILNDLTKVKP